MRRYVYMLIPLFLLFAAGCASSGAILEKEISEGEQVASQMEEINTKAKTRVLAQKLPISAIMSQDNKVILDASSEIPAMSYKLEQWRLKSVEGLHSLVNQVSIAMRNLIREFDTEELKFMFGDGSPLTDYIYEKKGAVFKYQVTELCRKYVYDTEMNVMWEKIVSDYNAYELASCNISGKEPQTVCFSAQEMIEWIGEFYTGLWFNQMAIAEMGGR